MTYVIVLLLTAIRQYIKNILIWIDQGCNVLLLGGDPDETISSVTGKYWRRFRLLAWLRKGLNWIDPGHTERTREADEGQYSVWAAVARKRRQLER